MPSNQLNSKILDWFRAKKKKKFLRVIEIAGNSEKFSIKIVSLIFMDTVCSKYLVIKYIKYTKYVKYIKIWIYLGITKILSTIGKGSTVITSIRNVAAIFGDINLSMSRLLLSLLLLL